MFCEVYLFDAPYHIDRPFDYSIDSEATPGSIVKVPFGKYNRIRLGVITKLKESSDGENIKPVHAVYDSRFSLGEEMLGLCLFLKEYTLCTFGEAVKCMIPQGVLGAGENLKFKKRVFLTLSPTEAGELLTKKGRDGIRSDGQRAVIEYLSDIGDADMELVRALVGVTPAHISSLEKKGIVRITEREFIRNPYARYAKDRDTSEIVLSDAQSRAYSMIEADLLSPEAKCALLFGITGSGKTKVIMKAIDKTLSDGKTVIMLVPEISLTPQTVSIFCKRYGERVAVIHSSLSKGERADAYRRIKRGEVDLVIGTRSAIFAPLENIGMIVIDEEHEHTYKSESDPKYHARDVAAYRCGKNRALLLLASATPSLESFYKARSGIYTLVPLRERYGGVALPDAIIVDMREELRLGNTSPISQRLFESLSEVYEKDNQAILFLNRRGYSPHVNCKECGEALSCPRCSVSLTYHSDSDGGRLLCHLCGYSERARKTCPACSSDKLSFIGFGTQKLESELSRILPDMPVMRMDADTTSGKFSYDVMLEDFRAKKADILLGTQMVAKGHDFPKVTLVGVALADTSLFVSDFRASERTFSLLTQVIGRAGRALSGGLAVIQTYAPKNEVIRLACKQDYEKFYEGEIALRRELLFPPFCDIVAITLTSEDEGAVAREAERLSQMISERAKASEKKLPMVVFGPFEAQVYKLNEKYRLRIIIKCRLNKDLRALFHGILLDFSRSREVTVAIDMNPLNV